MSEYYRCDNCGFTGPHVPLDTVDNGDRLLTCGACGAEIIVPADRDPK